MVFYFVQTNFFGQVIIFFYFLSHKARIFFLEFNIRLYDKNSESDYFFFLYQNQNIFFSNIENPNIFLEKNHNPPFKLNDRSLIHILSKANLLLIWTLCVWNSWKFVLQISGGCYTWTFCFEMTDPSFR
jgi:hypothetical protein